MSRRSVLWSLAAWLGAVAAVGLGARPARAYVFFQYRFQYYVQRNRRRLRWRRR
jgi:hypothetical protein